MSKPLQICSVVGARPQFVKLGPVAAAIQGSNAQHVTVHTGQHYDVNMSKGLFDDLNLPIPQFNLEAGSGSHAEQTATIMTGLESLWIAERPDWVLVYGDTNSTLAASLVASKLQIRVAHVESGLRSFNKAMPEEINRIVADHLSDVLFAPSDEAVSNLSREGLGDRTYLVGDVMIDVCLGALELAKSRPTPELPGGDYLVATLHRPYNTDDPARLAGIIEALAASPIPVLLPAHPRLMAAAQRHGITLRRGSLVVSEPWPYTQLMQAVAAARAVVTDSGGLQKEAYTLGVPCTTVRSETEWIETLGDEWNVLCFEPESIVGRALRKPPTTQRKSYYGNGDAAQRMVDVLLSID